MHAAIFRCYEAEIPTPRPVSNKKGDYFTFEKLSTSKGKDEKGIVIIYLVVDMLFKILMYKISYKN